MIQESVEVDKLIGKRLRARRRLLRLTQVEVARACGVKFQQIAKYESAANRLSAAMLWRLSEVLEVGIGYFFDGLEHATPPLDVPGARRSAAP